MPALTKPKNAETVSIIARVRCAPPAQNDRNAAQSKGIPRKIENGIELMILRNSQERAAPSESAADCKPLAGRGSAILKFTASTIDSPRRGSPHFRRVRDAISSWLDAEVGCVGA
jgi:hypothetical protein